MQTPQETLLFQLRKLYYTEKKVKAALEQLLAQVSSKALRLEMKRQSAAREDHLTKLERIFNYLMQEPAPQKSALVKKQLKETSEMLSSTDSPHLRDILIANFFQNVNFDIISRLKIAYMFSVDLESDTVSDLLQQLLESAHETGKALSALSIEEFNKLRALVQV